MQGSLIIFVYMRAQESGCMSLCLSEQRQVDVDLTMVWSCISTVLRVLCVLLAQVSLVIASLVPTPFLMTCLHELLSSCSN